MTSSMEAALEEMLREHAERAPVEASGPRLLAAVRRHDARQERRRRSLMAIASVAAVLVVAAGVWNGVTRLTRPSADRGLRTDQWGDIVFDVPAAWRVADAGAGPRHYTARSSVDGPFIATVRTGPECHRTDDGWACARQSGILERPADGVVTWLQVGMFDETRPSPPPGDDPWLASICGPAGKVYQGLRRLPGADRDTIVVLEGCIYGPSERANRQKLDQVLNSLRLAESPGAVR